jgi:hypothetical protein
MVTARIEMVLGQKARGSLVKLVKMISASQGFRRPLVPGVISHYFLEKSLLLITVVYTRSTSGTMCDQIMLFILA